MEHEKNWTADLQGSLSTQTLVVGDVIVAATDGKLSGVDLYTGAAAWPDKPVSQSGVSALASSGNKVFFLGFGADFGQENAKAPETPPTEESDPFDSWGEGDEFGDDDPDASDFEGEDIDRRAVRKRLIVLDAGTGEFCAEWLGAEGETEQLLDPLASDGVVMLRTIDGRLIGFDGRATAGPHRLWAHDLGQTLGIENVTPGPAGLGDRAAFFVADEKLMAINMKSGVVRWQFPASEQELERDDTLTQIAAPMVGNGLVIVCGQRAAYALNWHTGARVWSVLAPDGHSFNTPVVSWSGDTLFFTTDNGHAVGHVLSTGEEFWNIEDLGLRERPSSLLAPVIDEDVVANRVITGRLVHEDHVFLTGGDGTVHCVRIEANQGMTGATSGQDFAVSLAETVPFGQALVYPPHVVNGTLVGVTQDGQVLSNSISSNRSAYFDGTTHITLPRKESYRIGTQDFTIEMWVRSTRGGDLISQSPDDNGVGFRVALVNTPDGVMSHRFGDGAVQITLFKDASEGVLFAQTLPTTMTDGHWHHLSIARKLNQFDVLVDGVAQTVTTLLHRDLATPSDRAELPPASVRLYVSPEELLRTVETASFATSEAPFVLGGYVPVADNCTVAQARPFVGMMANVRIWGQALEASHVSDTMTKLLTGHEAGLLGCFPFSEPHAEAFKDSTNDQEDLDVGGVQSRVSNLALDRSLFPYRVPVPQSSWPYGERWCVRGLDAPNFGPAGNADVVCFVTDGMVYGVDAVHGKRKWGVGLTDAVQPAADHSSLYVQGKGEAVALDLETGKRLWAVDTSFASKGDAMAPVVTDNCVVVSPNGQVYLWCDKQTGLEVGRYTASTRGAAQPVSNGARIYVLDGDLLLGFEDPATMGAEMTPVTGSVSQSDCAILAADQARVFFHDGQKLAVFAQATLTAPSALSDAQKFVWNPELPREGDISGIALHQGFNRVILSYTDGAVVFLEYGSGRLVAEQRFDGAQMSAPKIEGAHVFVTCANGERSGVAALDIRTGQRRGFDQLDAAPTGPVHMARGAAFFGLDGKGHSSGKTPPLEAEALHSVVFGQTCAWLTTAETPPLEICDVDQVLLGETAALEHGENAIQQGNFALEAWVNARAGNGGTLLHLPEGSTPDGGPAAGFELLILDDGSISAAQLGAARLAATSMPTQALDGKWHHISAVFRSDAQVGGQMVYIYLDGEILSGVRPSEAADYGVETARCVTLAGNGFDGLLDEVRVWSTWLNANEINSRKNARLTGSEPDLVAAWSFDATGIVDRGPNALNTVDAAVNAGLELRLMDLSFAAPAYPILTAKSKGVKTVTERLKDGHGEQIKTGFYETNLTAIRADGSARAGTVVTLFASEPTRISGEGVDEKVQIDRDTSAQVVLGDKGTAKLELECSNLLHSPVLWAHADFMHANERLHISPVAESNRHVDLSPQLVAQSAMLEDYSFDMGDRIGANGGSFGLFAADAGAARTALITTIRAVAADGKMLPYLSMELWTDAPMLVEQNATDQWLTPQNPLRIKTGADGTVSVTIPAGSIPGGDLLACPAVMARASFMPRGSAFVIQPSEGAQKHLATATGDQIIGEAPSHVGEEPRILLEDLVAADQANGSHKARDQADAIAAVIQQMASLVDPKSPAGTDSAGDGGAGRGWSDGQVLSGALNGIDAVQTLHARAEGGARGVLTPEHMPHKHMILSLDGDGWRHAAFDHADDLDAHIAGLDMPHMSASQLFSSAKSLHNDEPARGAFGDFLDDVGGALEDVGDGLEGAYDDAKHFVIKTWDEIKDDVNEIVHCVEVAVVDAYNSVKTWVVKTAKAVFSHIKAFLKQVGVFLKGIYRFVRGMFQWGKIADISDVIANMISGVMTDAGDFLEYKAAPAVERMFEGVKETIAEALGVEYEAEFFTPTKPPANGPGNRDHDTIKGAVQSQKGRYLTQKMGDLSDLGGVVKGMMGGEFDISNPLGLDDDDTGPLKHFNQGLKELIEEGFNLLNGKGVDGMPDWQDFLVVLDKVINLVIDVAEDVVILILQSIGKMMRAFAEILNKPLDIPFLSALYKAVTGRDMSVLGAVCTLLALPVNVVLSFMDNKDDPKKMERSAAGMSMFDDGPAQNAAGMAEDSGLHFFKVVAATSAVLGGLLTPPADLANGVMNGLDPRYNRAERGGSDRQEPTCFVVVNTLCSFLSMTTTFFKWHVRQVFVTTRRDQPVENSSSGVSALLVVLFGSLMLWDADKLTGGDRTANFGNKGNIPIPLVKTVFGIIFTGVASHFLHVHKTDENFDPKYATEGIFIAEDRATVMSCVTLAMAWLNWSMVCKATEMEGLPLSSSLLFLIGGVNSYFSSLYVLDAGIMSEI